MTKEGVQVVKSKKIFSRKHIIPVVFVIISFCVISFYILLTQEPSPDPESEAIIRKEVAIRFEKELSELSDEELALYNKLINSDNDNERIKGYALLQRDPNELTDEHFAQSKYLFIEKETLTDIQLVRKLINLESLVLSSIK